IGVLGVLQENIKIYQQECAHDVITSLKKMELLNHVIIQSVKNIDEHSPYATFSWLKVEHNQNTKSVEILPLQLIPLQSQSTLAEAYLALLEQRDGGVYIYDKDPNDILGIV
ncbi:MAG: hypothetical protein QMC13_07200, partial [Colwellia sp.]